MAPTFLTEFDPRYGEPVAVSDGVVRVVAENPSKYTAWGTGTYVVGEAQVAVIDPGPDLTAHVDALLAALDGRAVSHILITHTHADHSPAAAALAAATGAPTYGFGPHPIDAGTGDDAADGPDAADRPDASDGGEETESGDRDFVPDVVVRDGDVLVGDGFRFECLHTPGHISNHVCFAEVERNLLFPGDHVMGWSTTVVSPPDGDMDAYIANLRRLVDRHATGRDATYLPTHGPAIVDPGPYVESLIEHRLERDRQILDLLAAAPAGDGVSVEGLVAVMYADVRPELHRPAGRSVLAHLIGLSGRGSVERRPDGRWQLRRRPGQSGAMTLTGPVLP